MLKQIPGLITFLSQPVIISLIRHQREDNYKETRLHSLLAGKINKSFLLSNIYIIIADNHYLFKGGRKSVRL